MGHALGLLHEQSRSDRDRYVTINWQNILANKEGNFYKSSNSDNYGAYDFDSVMHYDQYAFSTDGLPTIQMLPAYCQYQDTIGQLTHLSPLDQTGMQFRYPFPEAPPPPTKVTASVDTSRSSVELEWSGTQALGYHIYRHTVSNSATATLLASTAGSPYQDTSAVADTYYYYWLKATNTVGASAFSLPARGRRDIPQLAAPTGVSASDGTYLDRIRVTFNPVAGATHYRIHRKPYAMGGPPSPITGWIDIAVAVTNVLIRRIDEAGCNWWWVAGVRREASDGFWQVHINTNLTLTGGATAECWLDTDVNFVLANGVALGPTPCNLSVGSQTTPFVGTVEFEGTGEALTTGLNPSAGTNLRYANRESYAAKATGAGGAESLTITVTHMSGYDGGTLLHLQNNQAFTVRQAHFEAAQR